MSMLSLPKMAAYTTILEPQNTPIKYNFGRAYILFEV